MRNLCIGWALLILLSACSGSDPEPSLLHSLPLDYAFSAQTGGPGPAIPQVDQVVVDFMHRHRIPGVSVAITKDGKLVYARSFGKADIRSNVPVRNSHVFRTASVSKPITAAAIMKLVEAGKLSLNDQVFGESGILGTQYGRKPYHRYVEEITVRHLLQHTAGGWSNLSKDPMYANPKMTAAQLISWTLDNRPLSHKPGTTYAYSNFGYCILGRIIEQVSGQSYDQYVKMAVLEPCGVSDMQIGGNAEADRKWNEVMYYEAGKSSPYAHNITRMDAHGGWVASATDLARFLVRVDGFDTKPDILTPLSVRAMTTASEAAANYGLGWSVNAADNWWHTGCLPGSASEIVRTANGFTWVVLCNSRGSSPSFFRDLDQLVWQAVKSPDTQWPDVDLFLAGEYP
jgi:D-alanyl-D-alanine carboxypeptidase